MDDLLSIVVPTMNCEEQLVGLCESIKCLKTPCEVIFIDGFSSDGTVDTIGRLIPQAVVVQAAPNGIYDAYNIGLSLSTGDFVLFLGADDRVHDLLDKVLSSIGGISDECPMVVCQSLVLPTNLRTDHRPHRFNLISINFCHQSILYRRISILKNGYQVRFNVMADWVLNLQLYGRSPNSVIFLDQVISTYSLNGYSGRSVDHYWRKMHYFLKIKYLRTIDLVEYFLQRKL